MRQSFDVFLWVLFAVLVSLSAAQFIMLGFFLCKLLFGEV